METVTKKENKIVFSAEIDESLANAIRRYVYHIPVLAVDEVEISRNDSPLYDETVAHRVGLIPLKQKNKKEGTIKLSSKKEGFVYSGEFEGDFDIVYDKIPITLLNKGQEIEMKATVKPGIGKEHSKFLPGFIVYREASEITTDKEVAEKLKQIFPNIEIKSKGNKMIIMDNKEREVSDVCEGIAEKEKKEIDVKPTGELIVAVESFGQMESKDIFKKAVDNLKKELEEIPKKLK